MRRSIFVALLVATFAVCFFGFTSAEQNNLRRLKSGDTKLTGRFSDAATEEERGASSAVAKLVKIMKGGVAQKAADRATKLAGKNKALNQKEVQTIGKLVSNVASKEPSKLPLLAKVLIGLFGAAGAAAIIPSPSWRSRRRHDENYRPNEHGLRFTQLAAASPLVGLLVSEFVGVFRLITL
jgi:hypothetical protein